MHHASHDVHADSSPSFPVTAVPDSPRVEAELAEDRRAALESAAHTFDPEGLYALEVERDEAVDDLAANLPADASIRLARHHVTQRVASQWQVFEGWVATATTADSAFTLSADGERPLVAAEKLLNAWVATAPAQPAAA